MSCRAAALFLLGVCLAGAAAAQAPSPAERPDPELVVTAEACGECHISEYEVWKKTEHATGFKTLHRQASAEAIADKMGLRLIKRDSRCLNCHYTPTIQSDEARAVSGVSCESCHGAGRAWIDIHNDYGGKGVDHTSESAEHRAERIARSLQAGMRRPSDLYPVAVNCYGCHTVPDEELVNRGGHSTGSATFELLDWTGKIRHNFLQSFLTGDGTDNAERSPERKRLLYLVGRLVDLEFSLRGVAAASEDGIYLKAMLRRVRNAAAEVRTIHEVEALPQLAQILTLVKETPLGLGRQDALRAAAARVGSLTRDLLEARDGSRLASLDPLLDGTYAPPVAVASTDDAGSTVAPAVSPRPALQTASGKAHRTVGPGACSGCHAAQNGWWFEDPHAASVEPFFDQDPANVEIARLYGIDPQQMTRGNQVCMSCHGTVVSGRERRDAQDGVGCESCHGPAADYLEPHREGDKALGAQRPGYLQALQLGMIALGDQQRRAEVCAGCHYITEERLLATGHPSGADFDYVAGMAQVRHWEEPPAAPATLTAAFRTATAARGPIPQVEILTRPPVAETPAAADAPAGEDVTTPATTPAPDKPATATVSVGKIKTRVHPPSEFDTLGPSACSACHTPQNAWWPDDAHYRSADPFFDQAPKTVKIARLYGLSTGEMTRGNQICMDCHGTVASGKEKRPVQDGVSCESCHGPAASFLEPHKEGDKALGVERPGYVAALELGMRELRDERTRARTCTGCHLITEQRLIAAGHPAGKDFDYARGMAQIDHWQHDDDAAALAAAFRNVLAERGVGAGEVRTARGEATSAPQPLRPRPAEIEIGDDSESSGTLGLPRLPALDPTTTVEEVLLRLKERFERLYREFHPSAESERP